MRVQGFFRNSGAGHSPVMSRYVSALDRPSAFSAIHEYTPSILLSASSMVQVALPDSLFARYDQIIITLTYCHFVTTDTCSNLISHMVFLAQLIENMKNIYSYIIDSVASFI